MRNYSSIGAAILSLGGMVATATADETPTIHPTVTVSPIQGGTVVTPGASVNVPAGNGAAIQASVQVPVFVPNVGSANVTQPTICIGATIPLR